MSDVVPKPSRKQEEARRWGIPILMLAAAALVRYFDGPLWFILGLFAVGVVLVLHGYIPQLFSLTFWTEERVALSLFPIGVLGVAMALYAAALYVEPIHFSLVIPPIPGPDDLLRPWTERTSPKPAPPKPEVPTAAAKPTGAAPQTNPFAADVITAILNPGLFLGLYSLGTEQAVCNIDATLSIRIVNTQAVQCSIDHFHIEMKTADSNWQLLRMLPSRVVHVYTGSPEHAQLVEFDPPMLDELLQSRPSLVPGETIRGIAVYEYSDPGIRSSGGRGTAFRITVEDTAHHKAILESPTEDEWYPKDPYSSFNGMAMKIGGHLATDLTKFKARDFFSGRYFPQPAHR